MLRSVRIPSLIRLVEVTVKLIVVERTLTYKLACQELELMERKQVVLSFTT
jgi:hypothetical protein